MPPKIPCPCCDAAMAVLKDKSGKPYVKCREGHVQMFVKSAGLDRWNARYGGGTAPAEEKAPAPTKEKPKPEPKKAAAPAAAKEEPVASAPAKKGGAVGFFG